MTREIAAFNVTRRVVGGLAFLWILASCGDVAGSFDEGADVEGLWALESFSTSAGERDDVSLLLEIDLDDAAVRGETVCHTVLGSLSVDDDGAISFTIPGSTAQPCSDDLQAVEDDTVAGLEALTEWRLEGDQLTLAGPDQLMMEFRQAG